MVSVAERLSTTMAMAIAQVNFSRKLRSAHTHDLVRRTEIGGHAALGVLHQHREDHQYARNEYQGNANRITYP